MVGLQFSPFLYALDLMLAAGSLCLLSAPSAAFAAETEPAGLPVVKTASRLKYIDFQVGTGPSPASGNFVSITYTDYVKLPATSGQKKEYSTKPQQFDQVTGGY